MFAGLSWIVKGWWSSLGNGDWQRTQSGRGRGAPPHPHSPSHPPPGLDWDSGHCITSSSSWSSTSQPTQFFGRWPKRVPAPGKLRDSVSYWPALNGHHGSGDGWPAGWVQAAAGAGYHHDGVPPYSPASSWYGGPGGGDSNSPPARTNGNNNNNNTNNSRIATPTTTAASSESWSEAAAAAIAAGSGGPAPVRPGVPCSWEWWPPDPPEEWALSNAPWEPPPAPPVNGYAHHTLSSVPVRHEAATNGHDHAHEGRTSGVWWSLLITSPTLPALRWWPPPTSHHSNQSQSELSPAASARSKNFSLTLWSNTTRASNSGSKHLSQSDLYILEAKAIFFPIQNVQIFFVEKLYCAQSGRGEVMSSLGCKSCWFIHNFYEAVNGAKYWEFMQSVEAVVI